MIDSVYQAKLLPFDKNTVNKWIEQETSGNIKDLFDKDLQGLCVLLNCLYFSAKWNSPFKKVETQEFRLADGQSVQAKLMSSVISGSYLKKDDLSLVELPFKSPSGHALSFVAVMPDKASDVDKLGEKLKPDTFQALRKEVRLGDVDLTIPQLKVGKKIGMVEMQKALGEMGFVPRQPLPGIHRAAVLDIVEQKIKFEVDPEGAKAVAATYAQVERTCCPPLPAAPAKICL